MPISTMCWLPGPTSGDDQMISCDALFELLIIVVGYLLTMATSGLVVSAFAGRPAPEPAQDSPERTSESVPQPDPSGGVRLSGAVIGKCENFLALTFVLAGELTALALVFTAKSIVRVDAMKRDPQYYLGGTLVNLCYSVLMGYALRWLIVYFKAG